MSDLKDKIKAAVVNSYGLNNTTENVFAIAESHAAERAVACARWTADNWWVFSFTANKWCRYHIDGDELKTDAELYQLFDNDTKQK